MKTGAPRSESGAADRRRDVEKILARHFIVIPPAVQFDINEEFLSEEELSQPETAPDAKLAVQHVSLLRKCNLFKTERPSTITGPYTLARVSSMNCASPQPDCGWEGEEDHSP